MSGNRSADEPRANDHPPALEASALDFEHAFRLLQETVDALEQGGQPLDESLALYERGMALVARCAQQLGQAELRLTEIDSALGEALAALDDLAPSDSNGRG